MGARPVFGQTGRRFSRPIRYLGYVLVLLAAFGFLAAPARNAQPGNLVAAYAFDEGSGSSVADLSGNGNTGQVGSATWTVCGQVWVGVVVRWVEFAGAGG